MSIPTVQYRFSFGLKGDVSGNVCYLDEQSIIYPAGTNLVLFNIDQKTQRFMGFGTGGDGATALAVSPNKRYAAVAEKKDKPAITIFDLQTMRKRKVLSCPDLGSHEFVWLGFSPDSKFFIGQGGGPDWVLVYWHWEKAKIMATAKVSAPANHPVHQVSFNPQDNTQVCVIGEKLFKLFRYSEGNLKQFAFTKADPQNYLCHTWLSEDKLLMGTSAGKVQLFEVADLKQEYYLTSPPGTSSQVSTDMASRHGRKQSAGSSSTHTDTTPILSLLVYSKGFICSGGNGTLHLFEKTDEKCLFKRTRSVTIDADPSSQMDQAMLSNGATSNEIMCLTLSPSEENIVCSTRSQQLYNLTLSAADIERGAAFDYLSSSFHCAAITGLDVCIRKPIIATCSMDKTVRVWNYENNSLDLCKQFQEEAYSIALHPSGLFVLVGFSEKLRLMNVLIDDIRPFREFMIRGCRECAFSHGGHLFAAANANLIQIFSAFSFENTANFKGHNGKVRNLVWSADDSRLVSCSMDGAVYEWNVQAAKREKECVLKSCSYTSVSLSPDLRSTFAVGSDRTLKELVLADSQILRQVSAGDEVLTQVVLSHSGRMLFVGTSSGAVRAIKFPLTDPGDWNEHQAHTSAITRLCISCDDQYLFSVGEDGTLFSFRVNDREGRGMKTRERESAYAEEVLVTRADLEEKNTTMSELKTRVEELKMENEYQLRLKDMNYNEKIKDLTDKFLQEIEGVKAKNETLKAERERESSQHEEEVQHLVDTHSKEVQERENANSQKLIAEYEKYQDLQARSQRLQEDYERKLEEKEDAMEKALQKLTEHFEVQLWERAKELEQAGDELRQKQEDSDELLRQTEEDADEEILALKSRYERQLRQQVDDNLKLKGEAGILKKKVGSLQGEIDELKAEIMRLKQEVKKRDDVIDSLKNDIDCHKKEIQERDDTIQDKEKRIYDLKKKNQELEKFKFVLDYKIKELRRQMEPRENEIKRMKEQIKKMEEELEDYSRDNRELQRLMELQRQKLDATTKEMKKEQQQVHDLKVEIGNFKAGLHSTSQHIQEPKQLKEAVKALYRKYLRDHEQVGDGEHSRETDVHSEYARQREHMERTVSALRKKLAKDTEIHRTDKIRVMQENVSLLKEINDLRRELKISRTQIHDLEAAIKIARKSGFDDQSTLAKIKAPPPPSGLGKIEPTEESRMIEMQKLEIARLRKCIREMEQQPALAGMASRLPPLQAIATH